MLKHFFPKERLKSTYDIDWKSLKSKGIEGAIFDLDNTLVPHGMPADEKAKELFLHLNELGIKACILSNNCKSRVESFAREVDCPYIPNAGKPLIKNYYNAMNLIGTDKEKTVFVGDQLFTDILGANHAGVYGILVEPIHVKEEIQIVLKRYLENMVLFFYDRQRGYK